MPENLVPFIPGLWFGYSCIVILDGRVDVSAHNINMAHLSALGKNHPLVGPFYTIFSEQSHMPHVHKTTYTENIIWNGRCMLDIIKPSGKGTITSRNWNNTTPLGM
jgi:hypothetical protein